MKNNYPIPQNFAPTQEDTERVAKFINSKLSTKRVVSVNGIPMDKDGNVTKTEPSPALEKIMKATAEQQRKQPTTINPLRERSEQKM
ncbi:MAG: hypothetical protein LBK47_09975 [Prevotellaceae bacterium]|nr:hypothetical protein [Prevotellaceae bacterium]